MLNNIIIDVNGNACTHTHGSFVFKNYMYAYVHVSGVKFTTLVPYVYDLYGTSRRREHVCISRVAIALSFKNFYNGGLKNGQVLSKSTFFSKSGGRLKIGAQDD